MDDNFYIKSLAKMLPMALIVIAINILVLGGIIAGGVWLLRALGVGI